MVSTAWSASQKFASCSSLPHFKAYAGSAREETGIQGYLEQYLGASEQEYQEKVGGLEAIRAIELPTY